MDQPDPPRKDYDFKPREFKRDNALGQAAMPTAKELAMMAGPVTAAVPKPAGAKAGDPNDVYAILEHNRALEKEAGKDVVEIRKIRSRKRREYWLLLLSSELFLGAITWLGRGNPIQFVCGLAGMVIVGLSLTWIMWQIMGRY